MLLKRLQAICLFLLPVMTGMLYAGGAFAADDVTARALKLYEEHHYEEAAQLLRPQLASMDGTRQAAASLALGMIYLGNAKLYRALQETAQLIEIDYLTRLNKQKTGMESRFVYFYLGQALVEAGKPAAGIPYLQHFVTQPVPASSRAFAKIELGVAYSRQKQKQKAALAWARLDLGNPEIRAALAGAYAATGRKEYKPVVMAEAALSEAKTQGHIPGARMLRNVLRTYSQSGETEKALELMKVNEFKDASYVEELGDSKSISFYDPSLLEDMAKTYLDAAVKYLEQAGRDAKVGNTANYFLADSYLLQGKAEAALRSASAFLSQAQIPSHYRELARVLQASAQDMAGRHAEASATWQSLADNSAQNPALLAEVLQACTQAGADCTRLEKLALAAVESGEGKKYFTLNVSLGKYYLMKKDDLKAVYYMEAGRDKANKNKIEANDPVMLVGLAEAYYRNKNFSENLEIYFELSKQYPAVRQIQEAMQGIYSMEHQSAGDVKIF